MRRLALLLPLLTLAPLAAFAQTSPSSLNSLSWGTQCAMSGRAEVDPIVAPGGVGPHLHDFWGATIAPDSTYQSIRAANADRCVHFKDDESGYWAPTLLAADGRAIDARIMSAYYLVPFHAAPRRVARWPTGLRLISGDPTAQAQFVTGSRTVRRVFWTCAGTKFGEDGVKSELPRDCDSPDYPTLRARIYFPYCSNGATDSANHRDHVVFPPAYGGACPSTHPRTIPMLQVNLTYAVPADVRAAGMRLSARSAAPPDAYGMHVDFMDGWDGAAVQTAIDRCLKDGTGCGFVDPAPPTPTPTPTPEPTATPPDTAKPSGTVTVNGGATWTAARSVTLTLAATDPAPASGVDRMRLRDAGGSWTAWQPFAPSAAWTLPAGTGTKRVEVQVRDRAGNLSAVAADTIYLRER